MKTFFVWCPLNVNDFKYYQHVMNQSFELVKYGGYSHADVENMPIFERSYLHAILMEALSAEAKSINRLYR